MDKEHPDAGSLLEAVGEMAADWLGWDVGTTAAVRLVESRKRAGSYLHIVDLFPEGGQTSRRLVVKVPSSSLPSAPAAEAPEAQRPRLLPLTAGTAKHDHQHAALQVANERFRLIADARVSVNNVIGHLPEHGAVVVDFVDQPTLRDALRSSHLPGGTNADVPLNRAFFNAGLWLRLFHADPLMQPLPGLNEALRDSPQGLLDAVAIRVAYAERHGAEPVALRTLRQAMCDVVDRGALLPATLGPHHGDYSARNMFVDPAGRVTVFDIHAQWLVPTYEDVSFFLATLRTSRLYILTQGNVLRGRHLERYERAFLEGYFGTKRFPQDGLAPYETLIWLDRWAGMLWHWTYGELARLHPWRARQARFLCNRYFGRWTRDQVRRLRSLPATT